MKLFGIASVCLILQTETYDMTTANGDVTQHEDVQAVYKASGKYPALVGFDFLFATGRTEDEDWCKDYTNKGIGLAKDLYRRGGLPAFTWHWHDPSRVTDDFYSDKCTVKIADALNASQWWLVLVGAQQGCGSLRQTLSSDI